MVLNVFCQLVLLSTIFSRSIHAVEMAGCHLSHGRAVFRRAYEPCLLHRASIAGPPGGLHVLGTGNNVAMNIGVHVSLQMSVVLVFRVGAKEGLLGHMQLYC